MKTIYLVLLLTLTCYISNAQLVACRPKICLIDYNYHDDSSPNPDMDTIIRALPDILIDNTPGGYWHGKCTASVYTALGTQVFSYITGGYEGTKVYTDLTEDDLTANIARVVAIAADGATGVFLDEVTALPDPIHKKYIFSIDSACKANGLKLIVNPGTSTFDAWLMSNCDYLMSDEHYDGIRVPTGSESPLLSRILVVAQGIVSGPGAATITSGAYKNGFGFSYACNLYTALPTWFSSYYTLITHPYADKITGTSAVCIAANITMVDTASGGAWSSSSLSVASVGTSGVVTGVAVGTATISYMITKACGSDYTTKTITVNPLPTPSISSSGLTLATTLPYTTYQWKRGGIPITGATNATYDVTDNGTFTVTVTDANGCAGTSVAYLIYGLGLSSVNAGDNNISIYPNPATSSLYVSASQQVGMSVLGMDGRVYLDQKNTSSVDVSRLVPGLYMVRVYDAQGVLLLTAKFAKQ